MNHASLHISWTNGFRRLYGGLAPSHRMGFVQGVVSSSATSGKMIGPVIGGMLFDHEAMHVVFLFITLASAVPLLLFVMFSRLNRRSQNFV